MFGDILQKFRREEVGYYVLAYMTTCLSKALTFALIYFSGYICFVWIEANNPVLLSTPLIIATMQLLVTLKVIPLLGYETYFYIHVVLERYAAILNMKDIRMLSVEEPRQRMVDEPRLPKGSITLDNFSGLWNKESDPVLENLNFKFEPRKFYGITGKIGTGKTSLLRAFIQQMPFIKGRIFISGSFSYAEQEPVIFSESIRANVIFGAEFEEKRYWTALKKSCLIDDLKMFEAGDETEIGERGTNLSGGQKARLVLARALYFDADIYLFDDPISAVDAKVAKHIFEEAILPLTQ